MQVEFRSHFSGEKSASNGPGNTVPSKFCRNFLNIDLEIGCQISRDIRRVHQNTTLYYDVMCHRTDNMFRPFTIRTSSGLTSRAKEEIVKL